MTQDSLKRIAQAAKISTTGVEATAPALDGETWGDAADRGNKQLPKETLGCPQCDVMDRFTCSESRWRWQAGSEIRRRALNFFFPLWIATVAKISLLHRSFRIDGHPGPRIHLPAFPPCLAFGTCSGVLPASAASPGCSMEATFRARMRSYH